MPMPFYLSGMKNLFLLLFCCIPFLVVAQPRQTVGLVLSGGGAKGLAHVGVIKALEENGVKVDYIVGTSMGGIVGAMYASGYSAAEIEQIVLSTEFQEWATGQVSNSRKYLLFPEELQSPTMVQFSMRLDSSYNAFFQPSIITDAPLNYALAGFFRAATHYSKGNFDSLYIPFRCMGADIFTQREIVFKSGDLADAVRATMAVPLFFRPAKIDGKYLFDGGVFNNFPVDVMMKEFNPDLVIGVDVGTQVYKEYPEKEADELVQNPLKFLFMVAKESATLREQDVFLPIPVDNISPADFHLVQSLLDTGYRHAQQKMLEIKTKTGNLTLVRPEVPAALANHDDDRPEIHRVMVSGHALKKGQQKMVERLIWPGKFPISVSQLEKRYYMLTSQPFFTDSYPHFRADSAGSYAFELSVNPNKKIEFNIGGNLSSRNVSSIFLEGNYTFFNRWLYQLKVNVFAGVHYTSGRLQFRTLLPKQSLLYFESSATYNRWDYSVIRELFWEDDVREFLIRTDRYFDLSMGWSLPNRNTLTLTNRYFFESDQFWTDNEIQEGPGTQLWHLNGTLGQFQFLRNTLDYQQFPTNGHFSQIRARYVLASEKGETPVSTAKTNHQWAEIFVRSRHLFGQKLKVGYDLQGAYSTVPTFSNLDFTLLYLPAYQYGIDGRTFFNPILRAQAWAAGSATLIMPLKRHFHVRANHALYLPLQVLDREKEGFKTIQPFSEAAHISGADMVYYSPFGPISVTANYYHNSPFNWSFLFNIGFVMANPKGL